PFTQAKTQDTDYRYLPRSSEIRAFFERVHRHFPDVTSDPIMVVVVRRPGVPPSEYERYLDGVRALPGVVSAQPERSTSSTLAVVDAVSATPTQSEGSYRI